jgi:hypothetical protein
MSLHPRLVTLGVLLCSLSVYAAPKITIAPISGDKKSQVQSQISAVLCRTYTCVPYSRVFTKKKPDWNKIKSAQVQGLLVGGVAKAKSGKGKEVSLSWLSKPGKPAQNWSFPLSSAGKVTTSSLNTLSSDVGNLTAGGGEAVAGGVGAVGALAGGAAADTLATTPPTTGPATAAGTAAALGAASSLTGATVEPLPLPVTPTPPPPGEKSLADTPVAVDAGANQGSEGPRHQWRIAVDLGVDLINRNLSYSNVGGSSVLRPYTANLFFAPTARLSLYPIAFFSDGFFAGIGLVADYTFSVGLNSSFSGGAGSFSKGTSYSRMNLGGEWRMRFSKDSDFAVVPFAAYTTQKFLTNGSPDGSGFNGLPQFDLTGIKFGLRFDIPVSSGFWIVVGGDYVLWNNKNLAVQDATGGTGYTFTGSASGFEGDLGLRFKLISWLWLGVDFFWNQTTFTFDPGQPQAAGSATDRYLGGTVSVRFQF